MFYSILFPKMEQYEEKRHAYPPSCFKDLNLNQVFDPIIKAKKEFELEAFFYTSLHDTEVIAYRQNVMRELEKEALRALFSDSAKEIYSIGRYMNTIRAHLSSNDSWNNNYLTKGKMLDFAERYCHTIAVLQEGLSEFSLRSDGLCGFQEYLAQYCASENYTSLFERVKQLRKEFSVVEYCMLIKNGTIRVRKYEGQDNHSNQILACFEKFRQGNVKDYRHKLSEEPHASHVEAAVLSMIAKLYKDEFADLNDFCSAYFRFDDITVLRFVHEIQFYLSWLEFISPLKQANLPFCYPKICSTTDCLYNYEGLILYWLVNSMAKLW